MTTVKRILPWALGAAALGTGIYFAARAVSGLMKTKARSAKMKLAAQPVNENKPYPVEHTSKKHSKTKAHQKDFQNLTH